MRERELLSQASALLATNQDAPLAEKIEAVLDSMASPGARAAAEASEGATLQRTKIDGKTQVVERTSE